MIPDYIIGPADAAGIDPAEAAGGSRGGERRPISTPQACCGNRCT